MSFKREQHTHSNTSDNSVCVVTKQTHIYIHIGVCICVHAAWLLTSCLAEIPRSAATIKFCFWFNRVSAANVGRHGSTHKTCSARTTSSAQRSLHNVAGIVHPLGRFRG